MDLFSITTPDLCRATRSSRQTVYKWMATAPRARRNPHRYRLSDVVVHTRNNRRAGLRFDCLDVVVEIDRRNRESSEPAIHLGENAAQRASALEGVLDAQERKILDHYRGIFRAALIAALWTDAADAPLDHMAHILILHPAILVVVLTWKLSPELPDPIDERGWRGWALSFYHANTNTTAEAA